MAPTGYMEQLADPIFELNAIAINGDGGRAPFSLSICDGGGDAYEYCCKVRCPYIRDKESRIFGVDKEQALALAIKFIDQMLRCRGVTLQDNDGANIQLPAYEYEVTD